MGETTVTTVETPDEDPSVLAQAAVASVGVSAVAAVKAEDANQTAEEANARATSAQEMASAALSNPSGVSTDEARAIAREEAKALLIELERLKAEETAPTTEVTVETVDPQVLPPSVEDTQPKKRTISDWWHES
jgi:hypothetical protein